MLQLHLQGASQPGATAVLVVMSGPDQGMVFPAESRLCLVGRDPACHLMLKDESISRFHAHFKKESDGTMIVKDLNSLNGTFMDGKPITTTCLKKGDRILLGKRTVITYQ